MASPASRLIACHDCDQLYEQRPLGHKETARCARCGCFLYRQSQNVIDRTLAWALSSLVLFIVANSLPFLEFHIAGRAQVGYLITGVLQLHEEGYWPLAAMVAFTSVAAPAVVILGMMWLVLPLRFGWHWPGASQICKLITRLREWNMMEVYLLGVIVTIIKLSQMADIVIGPACFAFMALIGLSTAALGAFEPRIVWEHLEGRT